MKLIWSPEIALKSHIDTVKSCETFQESDDAEMISAMAGGWNPRLIIEAWSSGSEITTSIGLDIAARHSGARFVCILQNECSRSEYTAAVEEHGSPVPELMVGEATEVMERLPEVEFMVVDGGRKDLCELFRVAKVSHRGAVLLCKGGGGTRRHMAGFRWDMVVGKKACVVRSVIIPVGQGLDIAYVKENREYGVKSLSRNYNRWITRIDRKTGEEHVFRG